MLARDLDGGPVACGARTALITDESEITDAGAFRDGGRDVKDRDAGSDGIPRIDGMKPDVAPPINCPDAGTPPIYLVTGGSKAALLSFFPPTRAFAKIGDLVCPNSAGGDVPGPNSMGVARDGNAYVVYRNSNLYEVSTSTAACALTSFSPTPMDGFEWFGMGFSGDTTGDQLYVAAQYTDPSAGLATIDVTSFAFSFVAEFNVDFYGELTGTNDGRLYGWSPHGDGGTTLVQIDRKNAQIIGADTLVTIEPPYAYAAAFRGGKIYIFAAASASSPSNVTEYDLVTKKEKLIASYPDPIAGAGVSTCAPSQ